MDCACVRRRTYLYERAALVATATTVTDSIHRGDSASVEVAGNGYQVQLLGCRTAGLQERDNGHVVTAPDVLVVHDGTNRRLADNLSTTRIEQ